MDAAGFTDLERIHDGGQAIVYRARRVSDDQPVVLKMLRGPYPTPDQQARFALEHRLTRAVAGPGVISVEGWTMADTVPVLVLEDFGGTSLDRKFADGHPPLHQALFIATALTRALAHVHEQRVLHLDLNPSNAILSPDAATVKLIDFGLSTDLPRQSAALRVAQVLRGTLRFVAPEQTGRMNRSLDHRSDFYSLGATIYWLLTGQPPFRTDDPLELVHAHLARRPESPSELDPAIPEAVSRVVLKLLEKDAEERYQSTFGILADLERCQAIVRGETSGDDFEPGRDDRSSRFHVPERLYGRETELDRLLGAFKRVAGGAREVVLVEGAAGMGKTSLVREVQRPIASRSGAFVAGKFDQFKRDIPYHSLAQALQQFARQVLTGQHGAVDRWRDRLTEAVAPNGRLLTDLIPELELTLGEQPPVPDLPPLEAESRLHNTFRRFMRVLATAEHPLVVFMDDLQWADLPSLELLRVLATDPGGSHVLLIGAYRGNEVGPGHPLLGLLDELDEDGVPVQRVQVGPLGASDVERLVADTLDQPESQVVDLASTCRSKTAGNPFFLHRFLLSLAAEELVRFDPATGQWVYDLERIKALDVTDNVVQFMAARIGQLPREVRVVLEAASVVGGTFGARAVAEAGGQGIEAVLQALDEPQREGLVEQIPSSAEDDGELTFRFVHDRIQQAAYERTDDETRARLHWRVGQGLLERSGEQVGDDELFDLINHLNLGFALHESEEARVRLARLNLRAGQRALQASAYAPASRYFSMCRSMLGEAGWSTHPDLMRQATQGAARGAYLTTDFDAMERLVDEAVGHLDDPLERIRTLRVRMEARVAQHRNRDAIDDGLAALKLLGVELPRDPGEAEVGAALHATFERLAGVDLAALPEAPLATDPRTLLVSELCSTLAPPAFFVAQMLMPLFGAELVRITVEDGRTPHSGYGFALLGLVLSNVGEIDQGHAFAELGMTLIRGFDDRRMLVRAGHVAYGFSRHWKEPAGRIIPDYAELFRWSVDVGDFEYAAWSGMMTTVFGLYMAPDLGRVRASSTFYTEAMREMRQGPALAIQGALLQAILNLTDVPEEPVRLHGPDYDEDAMLKVFEELQDPTCLFVHWCMKAYIAGLLARWDEASELVDRARPFIHGVPATLHLVPFEQIDALASAMRARTAEGEERSALIARAETALAKLETWAGHNPEGHGHRPVLVRGALAWTRGDRQAALEDLERAAAMAREALLPNDQGLALELAGELCLDAGLTTAARAYFIEARYAWERWGSALKVHDLEQRHPSLVGNIALRSTDGSTELTSTVGTTGTLNVDAAAVIRASQAIAKERDLATLVATVVRIAMELSGALRCLVVTPIEEELVVTARGTTEPELEVAQDRIPLGGSTLGPDSIIQYVARTRTEVVLDDAGTSRLFASDPYLLAHEVRSVLCLPVEQQGRLIGVLYLEHGGSRGVFTKQRVTLLRVLLAQAAISVENARLIDSLEDQVAARTRQLAAATEQAQAASEAKSTFVRSMSHELRTPLNAILGYAQLLADSQGLSGKQLDGVSTIQRSGRHLLALINDLLDMSKIEAGRLDLMIEPTRLEGFTEGVVDLFRPPARAKGLELTVDADTSLPMWIETDARRLRQILLNLVGNAVKFTTEGRVAVATGRTELGDLQIAVRDTGPGIPADRLERIFEPFEQAGGSVQRAQGTGLGLAIARQIARQMGGDLRVDSTLGVGSTFVLEVPIVEAVGPGEAIEPPAREPDPPPTPVVAERKEPSVSELVYPDRPVLEALLALVHEGSMSAIVRRAEALAAQDDALAPFAARLRALARDFDDAGVEALLTEALG